MYAHQVIEDLKKISRGATRQSQQYLFSFVHYIQIGQKFHLGDCNKMYQLSKHKIGKPLFNNENYLRLPYDVVYIDYCDNNSSNIDNATFLPPKTCAVIVKTDDSRWRVAIAVIDPRTDMFIPLWVYFDLYIGIGIKISPAIDGVMKQYKDMVLHEYASDLMIIQTFIELLNCKNISTEKIVAPTALNKKRRKHGKKEIFDYHVLNVVVPSKKSGYSEKTEPLSHNRVHLCRGHFKEYTQEHPLFGRLTGLYWWQPHIRGQNKDGIVMKDYSVTIK